MSRTQTRATRETAAVARALAAEADHEGVHTATQVYVVMVKWFESQDVRLTVVRGGRLWVALCRDGFEEMGVGE